jgi:hypothetical protein
MTGYLYSWQERKFMAVNKTIPVGRVQQHPRRKDALRLLLTNGTTYDVTHAFVNSYDGIRTTWDKRADNDK